MNRAQISAEFLINLPGIKSGEQEGTREVEEPPRSFKAWESRAPLHPCRAEGETTASPAPLWRHSRETCSINPCLQPQQPRQHRGQSPAPFPGMQPRKIHFGKGQTAPGFPGTHTATGSFQSTESSVELLRFVWRRERRSFIPGYFCTSLHSRWDAPAHPSPGAQMLLPGSPGDVSLFQWAFQAFPKSGICV